MRCSAILQEVAKLDSERPDLPRSGHASATLPAEHAGDVIVFGGCADSQSSQAQRTSSCQIPICLRTACRKPTLGFQCLDFVKCDCEC